MSDIMTMLDQYRKVLVEFCDDIDAAGGVSVSRGGTWVRPVGDHKWADLGTTYMHACEALGRTPKVVGRK